jgi:hypothetical protein
LGWEEGPDRTELIEDSHRASVELNDNANGRLAAGRVSWYRCCIK